MSASVAIPVRKGGEIVTSALVSLPDEIRVLDHSWSLTARGYAQTFYYPNGRKTSTSMHRLVLGLEPGDRRVGHHKNGNPLDNRRENLEIVGSQREHIRGHFGTDSFARQARRLARAVATAARLTIADTRHDLAGYRNRGCRCDVCRTAAIAHLERYRGREPRVHGTTASYNNYGCRCAMCRAANSKACRLYAQRKRRAEA